MRDFFDQSMKSSFAGASNPNLKILLEVDLNRQFLVVITSNCFAKIK